MEYMLSKTVKDWDKSHISSKWKNITRWIADRPISPISPMQCFYRPSWTQVNSYPVKSYRGPRSNHTRA